MNSTCKICTPSEKYKKLLIKEYTYWTISLHENQYFLGRCVISLKRHLEDFFDISEAELKEFYEITKILRDAIKTALNTSMFNYATLGNVVKHVHLHVIPRYETAVNFDGITFKDERWGYNYSPYNKNFNIQIDTLIKIKDKIKNYL